MMMEEKDINRLIKRVEILEHHVVELQDLLESLGDRISTMEDQVKKHVNEPHYFDDTHV